MTKRFVTLALTMLVTMVAWADDVYNITGQKTVNTATTWNFNNQSSTITSIKEVDNGLYGRGSSNTSRQISFSSCSESLTFTDGTSFNVTNYAITSGVTEGRGKTITSAAYNDGSYFAPTFAFNTTVAGTTYVKIKKPTTVTSNSYRLRIDYNNGTAIDSKGYSKDPDNNNINEISYSNAGAGTIFVGSTGENCEIYAIRFVPSVDLPTFSQNGNTITITAGICNINGATVTTYYTTDGSDPATSGTRASFTENSKKITISANTTIKAISVSSTDVSGAEASEEFAYTTPVTISFDSNGGSTVDAITQLPGTPLTSPNNPTKEGYTFDYWYSENESTAYEFTTMPAEDLTLTAHWTATNYTVQSTSHENGSVTFSKEEGGTYTETITNAHVSETIYVKAEPVSDNYTFSSLTSSDIDGLTSAASTSFTMPANNVDITATFSESVNKTDPTVVGLAAANLTYTGSAQNLVTEPTVEGGTIFYSTSEAGEYTTTIPQGTDAGNYSVWYKVTGDKTHNDISATEVGNVKINKANLTLNGTLSASDSQGKKLSEIAITNSGRVIIEGTEIEVLGTWAFENGDTEPAIGTSTHAAIFTPTQETGKDNYNAMAAQNVSLNITAAGKQDLTFNGTLSATATYGTQVKDITISTEDKVTVNEAVVEGSWSFDTDDTEILKVDNTTAKTATFHPTNDADNYNTLTMDITPTISAATLTITANDQTIEEGGNITEGIEQVTASGLVGEDALTSITLTASTSEHTITPSDAKINNGDANGNYNIQYVNGILTINEAQTTTYTLTFSSADANMGSVSVNPTATDNKYEHGAEVTITATAKDGYEFDYWTVDNNKDNEHTTTTLTVTMTTDKTVVATFKEKVTEPTNEEYVDRATTWTFENFSQSTIITSVNGLYNRSSTDQYWTFENVTIESPQTFSDETPVTIINKATTSGANSTANKVTITAGASGTNATPWFAFNAKVKGNCYVLAANGTGENATTVRVYFRNTNDDSQASSLASTENNVEGIQKIMATSTEPGVFFIGGPDRNKLREIYAIRFVPTRSITIGSTSNGTVTPDKLEAGEGQTITLTVTPDNGYELESLKANDTDVTTVTTDGNYTFTMPDADVTITATFKEKQKYTVSIAELTDGTITASPNPAMEGEEVTLTITPDNGNQLKSGTLKAYKTGDEGTLVTIGADNTFTMPAYDVTVTAEFEAIPANTHTITLPAAETLVGGTVTVTTAAVAKGETVTLTIAPSEGYEVDQVMIDGTTLEPDNGTYKFTMPDNDVTVSVTFKKVDLNVTAASGIENGSLSFASNNTNGANKFQIGDVVTITATPSSNDYQLKANSLTATYNDGAEKALDINENNQFTMPGYNVTVTAAFEQKPIEEVICTPTISIDTDGVVTITAGTSSVEGATTKTYYTVDGTTEPTAESTEYKEPFEVVSGTTVKAISINAATNKFSEVESKEYTYDTSVLNKISKTTTWTFEQFANNQQLSNTNVYGYKGLYIKGHNDDKYATVLNGSASTIIEGTEISVSKYLNLPGGSATIGTVANELPADRVAFCTSVPGTVYAYVMGRYAANKSLFIEVAGEQDKTQIPEKIDNNNVAIMLSHDITTIPEGGANVFIGSESGALDIYAIKFVAKDTYTLTTTSDHGTITVKREGEEEATEDRTFVAGTKLVLTAEASQGYNFSKWTVDGADAGTKTTLNLTMDATKNVVAVYQEKDAVMSAVTIIQPTEGGIVKVMKGETEVTSGETVADGTTLTVVVTPERFYQVEKITVTDADNNEITLETDNSFKMPEKAVTVTATLIKEVIISEPTTWTFNNLTAETSYSSYTAIDGAYLRSNQSSRSFTVTDCAEQTLTFGDNTEIVVNKSLYVQANATYNGNDALTETSTAGDGGTAGRGMIAINTSVPGTFYAKISGGTENKVIRMYFADGSTIANTSVTSDGTIQEISYTSSKAGSFFVGGITTGTSNIYAIRFVPTKSYTVKATAGTGGSVSIKDGKGNAITSGSKIAEGTKVVLTATPDAANDYGFKNWTKADGTVVSTDADFTIESLSEDIDVTANFEQVITYTITTPEVTGGTVAITVGGETIASGSKIPAGTEVTVTATPASGYYFVNWGSEDLTDNPYTFTPTASTTLTAKFEAYPGTITYDFMGAYDADKKEIVCTGDETAMLHYIRTDDKSVSTNALFVSTQVLDLNGRISTSENSLTYAEKGITIKSGRAIAIHNLKENDVIRIEFDGELYYAWNNSKSERESNVLADMSTGDMIKTMTPYTVSSINATNNYVVFYTGAATTISQISINEELVLKSVPKPTVSSTYTVNEDSYTYTIEYMEGATLYYTLPGGEEQSKSGGESLEVNVTKLGDLTAYAKYGDLTSETASQRVYAPTPKIESNGVYDFSQVSSVMLKDYTLGTIGYGDAVTIGEIVLYKPDAVVAKTLDRFAFAPKVNEKGSNAGDWMLLGAGRLRAKNTVADTLAVLNLKQGEYVTFNYSGAELKYMSQSTATLAEGTDVLTSGQGYEVKSDGVLLLTIPVTDGKNCDITKIAIASEETVTAPTLTLKSVDTPNVIRLRNGISSFGSNVVAYYTTDGTAPSETNGTKVEKFPHDITLNETCTIKAIAISEQGAKSAVTTVSYVQSENSGTQDEVQEFVSVIDENHATVTSLVIGDNTTTVTISGEAGGVPVTDIADNLFTAENTASVGAIDLSETAISVSGDRTDIAELKNINAGTLVYVPSTAGSVTGTNVVTKTGTGTEATYACTDYQVFNQKLEADAQACAVPHDFHADQAKLVREFTSNVKCTVCLPYPFKATGGTFYYFKGISDGKVQMQAVEAGATLEANTPYIFEPASDLGDISASDVEVSISDAPQTENGTDNFTFVGTYKTIVWDNPTGIYGFAAEGTSKGQFVRVGSGASIVACRAYLKYTEGKLNGAATRNVNSLPDRLDVEWIPATSNGGTTGITGTEQQTADEEPVYNLNGQRVDDSYKGLIIKNGKKMVKK